MSSKEPIPKLLIPSVHKKILLPIFAFFIKDKLNKTAGPKAVAPSSSISLNDLIIADDDCLIEFLIKLVFSSPIDLIFDSLFISFSFISITLDKQSPLTSISLPKETIPTLVLGEFSSKDLILFSIDSFTKSNLLI